MTQPQSPTEYLRNKDIQNSFFFKIKDGEGYYVIDGKKVAREVIDKKYPLANKVQAPSLRWKGENPRNKKASLSGEAVRTSFS